MPEQKRSLLIFCDPGLDDISFHLEKEVYLPADKASAERLTEQKIENSCVAAGICIAIYSFKSTRFSSLEVSNS